MSALIELHHQLWDWAGVDGLQFAQALFGEAIAKIAPFQSIEASYRDTPCSVLRLCEGNFRIAVSPDVPFEHQTQPLRTGLRMWLKPSDRMEAIALPDALGQSLLPAIASTKPIYRLNGLQLNCAVPARIGDIAVLVWRHAPAATPIYEIQVAASHRPALEWILETHPWSELAIHNHSTELTPKSTI